MILSPKELTKWQMTLKTNFLRENNFALQIDESTVTYNETILLAYVKFINECKEIVEELLFATSLITIKGSSIFQPEDECFIR